MKCMRSGAPRTRSASFGRTPKPNESRESFERSSRVAFNSRSAGTSVPTGSGCRSEALAGADREPAGASDGLDDATWAAGGAGVGPGALDADRTACDWLASVALWAVKVAPRFEGE